MKRIALVLTLRLVAATSATAQARNVKGPNAVAPGSRVAFKGKGYKPGAETLARVIPVNCPAGGNNCVNAIKNGKAQWKVKSSGKVRAKFRWPKTYTGYPAPMSPERYQWQAGEKVRVQICEFEGGFKCASTYTRIKASGKRGSYDDCGNTTITASYDLPMKAKNMSCGNAQEIAHRYFEKIRHDYPPARGDVEFVKRFRCKWQNAYYPYRVAWVCRHRTKKKALKTFYPPENIPEGRAVEQSRSLAAPPGRCPRA